MALKVFFLIYVFTVIWFTVLKRSVSLQTPQFEVLWSYKKWLAGDWELGIEILGNMAMFFPFGFLLMELCRAKGKVILIAISALLFSLTIETLQLVLMRGLFEWDDLISNGVGAILGCLGYQAAARIIAVDKFPKIVFSTGILFVAVCAGVYISGFGGDQEADRTSRIYCFQIDEAEVEGDQITLTGFAFWYERKPIPIELVLQSTSTREMIELDVRNTTRADVNQYFLCQYDYEPTGFIATGKIDPSEEYEVLILRRRLFPVSTGVFVTGEDVHYVAEKDFVAPEVEGTDLEPIVKRGVLRVFEPDEHCWVYQYEGALYWVVDQDFYFEDDGTTYIQYQLYTTQTQNLPAHRLENNWLWDNIGAYFEANELEGDFGAYRVMRRDIPSEYSVTSIITGYYANGHWIWERYFRPYYEFEKMVPLLSD